MSRKPRSGAFVDVWRTLGLPFTEMRVLPLGPAKPAPEAHCTYPELKRAAE